MHDPVSWHAQDRAEERLGRPLRRAEWMEVLLSILNRRAPLLRLCAGGQEIYLVTLGDLEFMVVWVPETASVKTILVPHRRRPSGGWRAGQRVRGRAEPRRGGGAEAWGWE